MKYHTEYMKVDPDFRKLIKSNAALSGMTLKDYTRKIADLNKKERGFIDVKLL